MNVMKKAVIKTGGKQYVVSEGDTITVERVKEAVKGKPAEAGQKLSLEALMVIDGDKVEIGAPIVDKVKVSVEIVEADVRADKVTAIRYKAKKRVKKTRGHRQHQTVLKIGKIV